MEETISLQELLKTFKKRFTLIVISLVTGIIIAGVISFFFLTPIYQASTQILVNQQKIEQQPFTSQDIQANLQLINTYNIIIKSPAILSKVIEILDLKTTPTALTSQINVTSAQNSQVVNISVQDPESYKAVDIANTTAEVFQEEIKMLMNVDNVNILSPAINGKNPTPVKPDPILNMVIGAILGLMIGIGIAFLMEYFDTTVKTERDIEELLALPILGLVSPISENDMPQPSDLIQNRREKR